jgi:hypothetical protein
VPESNLPNSPPSLGYGRDDHGEASVFLPENLLREARRQRALPAGNAPDVCLLDPDGDVVRVLAATGRGQRSPSWACYHTDLWLTEAGTETIGVVGNAVGAPFAVLIAEELFAAGGGLLVTVTSAGQLDPHLTLPATILVERSLRGEGTRHAYLPSAPYVAGDRALLAAVARELRRSGLAHVPGGT